MSERFRHRFLIAENRKALLWGAFSLLAVDFVSSALPMLVKNGIDILKGQTLFPLWATSLSGGIGLASIVCLYIGIHACVAYLRYWWRVFLIWSSFPLADRMRRELFEHVLSLHRDFFKRKRIGDLLSSLTTDTENLRNTVSVGALMVIDAAINFILFPSLMFYLDRELSLMVIPVLALAAASAIFLSGRVGRFYDEVQNLTGHLSGKTHELIGGIRAVKGFAAQERFFQPYSKLNDSFKRASLVVARYESFYGPALEGTRSLCLVFVLIYGGLKVVDGHMSLSSLIAFQMYLNYMDWPMMAVGWSLQMYRHSQAASKRIGQLMQIENPLWTSSHSFSVEPLGALASSLDGAFSEAILSCHDVRIVYDDGSHQELGPFNLELKAGEWLGLTGPVGFGKSSLLEALSRQRDGKSGTILFRGRDLKSYSRDEIAKEILYIPQEAFLFSRSVGDNLKMGENFSNDAELQDLIEALQFEEEVFRLRGGLNIRLGERGINFSGGQKQRLSLGRALIRRRSLYLFDDVFSHVDMKTEARLIDYLKAILPANAAVILVSHRPSTLSYCHRSLELSKSLVDERGVIRA